MLIANERELVMDESGHINDEMVMRLNYLRLTTLVNDSSVKVINGKISGIYEKLPMLEKGPAIVKREKPLADSTLNIIAPTVEKENSQQELRVVWSNFRAAVERQNFKKVIELVDTNEAKSFLVTPKGNIKASMRIRLAAMDSTAWKNLALKNGKLLRVWNSLPPVKNREEVAAKKFINNINQGDWELALQMLNDFEKEYLSNENGKMKEKFKKQLQTLTNDDWDAFFLFREKLSGTLDWLGLGPYGQNEL